MPGRNAVNLEIYDPEKKKKKTKKNIADREKAELRIGNDNYIMPKEIAGDLEAMNEWCRITKLYKDAGLKITSSADVNILARYCMLCSEYRDLLNKQVLMPDKTTYTHLTRYGEAVAKTEEYVQWEQMNRAIHATRQDLVSLEDRLFLTPLAKFKNIPMIVKKDEKEAQLERLGFGGI